MLYKKIAFVGYITIQFLATRTTGGTIMVSNGQTSCGSGTGTCTVYCDTSPGKSGGPDINCGSASACNVYVTADKCLESGSISAGSPSGGQILTAYCQAAECFKKTDIYGDTGAEITVYCDSSQASGKGEGDECKRLRIHGETARFVKVQVNSNSNLYGSKDEEDKHAWIKCPENRDYTGPEPASCVIDANGGGIDMTTVWAYEGTPADFAVTGSTTNVDIDLKCYRSGSWVEVDYHTPGTCSRSRAPTKAPTTTKTPTENPTPKPTKNPTKNPTKLPTRNPTKLPTKGPTANPTKQPTGPPTSDPTKNPTNNPTPDPTAASSDSSDEGRVVEEQETTAAAMNMAQAPADPKKGDDTFLNLGLSELELYMVACTLFIIYTCCILGWVILRKMKEYRKKRAEIRVDDEVEEDSMSAEY